MVADLGLPRKRGCLINKLFNECFVAMTELCLCHTQAGDDWLGSGGRQDFELLLLIAGKSTTNILYCNWLVVNDEQEFYKMCPSVGGSGIDTKSLRKGKPRNRAFFRADATAAHGERLAHEKIMK